MIYVLLLDTLPGVRSTIFVFPSWDAAMDFEEKIHELHPQARTEMGGVGDPDNLTETLAPPAAAGPWATETTRG